MSKRTSGKFKRRAQDAYFSPPEVGEPLLGHLEANAEYIEPCAGAGDLVRALRPRAVCNFASDISPQHRSIVPMPFHWWGLRGAAFWRARYFITNPPWTREILHPLISWLCQIRPTWLLFDADWMHTKQAEPFLKKCVKIVSVGRVSWMGNGVSGFDNCAWYLFDAQHNGQAPRFFGRAA